MSFRGSIVYLYMHKNIPLKVHFKFDTHTPSGRQTTDSDPCLPSLSEHVIWIRLCITMASHSWTSTIECETGIPRLTVNDNHRISQTGESYLIATHRAFPAEKEMGAGEGGGVMDPYVIQ